LYLYGSAWSLGSWLPSDLRLKQGIEKIQNVGQIIEKLNPVNYSYIEGSLPKVQLPKERQSGFIAQELERVIPEAVRKDSNGIYAVNYVALIPYLVSALQMNQLEIDSLKRANVLAPESVIWEDSILNYSDRNLTDSILEIQNSKIQEMDSIINQNIITIDNLKNELDAIKECISKLNCSSNESRIGSSSSDKNDNPYLSQNIPNPFSDRTKIPYYLPNNVNSSSLVLFSLNGTIIQKYDNLNNGHNEIEFNSENLSMGIYIYSLFINGQEVDSKRMLIQEKR
jgi:hypothetical protein